MPGKHAKRKHGEDREPGLAEPLPGTAAMGQGQPEAGVDAPDEEKAEQADNVVTGGEALEEQQQNPDLDDTSGARP